MPKQKRSGGAERLPGADLRRKGKAGRVGGASPTNQSEEFRVNYLIHDVSRLRRLLFDQEMRPYGVTHVQWTALAQLSRSATGGMTQADLARLLGVGKVAVSRVVDRLEHSGLVKRSYDAKDRRVNLVCVTPEAEAILSKMTEVSRRLNDLLLAGIDQKHIAGMEHALAAIKSNARSLLRDTDDDGDTT